MKIIPLLLLLFLCTPGIGSWPPTYGTMGYAQEVVERRVMNIYADDAMVWMIRSGTIANNTLDIDIMLTGNLTSQGLRDIETAVGDAMTEIDSRSPDTFEIVDVIIYHVTIDEEYPRNFTLKNSWT